MLIIFLVISTVFATFFGVHAYHAYRSRRVVPHALPEADGEEKHFVDQIFDYRSTPAEVLALPPRLEDDQTVECYSYALSACPRCNALDNQRQFGGKAALPLPPFELQGWSGFWFPLNLRRGPSLLKDSCTQGPLRREVKVTLQRCYSCGAVWRVRLNIRPAREGRPDVADDS